MSTAGFDRRSLLKLADLQSRLRHHTELYADQLRDQFDLANLPVSVSVSSSGADRFLISVSGQGGLDSQTGHRIQTIIEEE